MQAGVNEWSDRVCLKNWQADTIGCLCESGLCLKKLNNQLSLSCEHKEHKNSTSLFNNHINTTCVVTFYLYKQTKPIYHNHTYLVKCALVKRSHMQIKSISQWMTEQEKGQRLEQAINLCSSRRRSS